MWLIWLMVQKRVIFSRGMEDWLEQSNGGHPMAEGWPHLRHYKLIYKSYVQTRERERESDNKAKERERGKNWIEKINKNQRLNFYLIFLNDNRSNPSNFSQIWELFKTLLPKSLSLQYPYLSFSTFSDHFPLLLLRLLRRLLPCYWWCVFKKKSALVSVIIPCFL